MQRSLEGGARRQIIFLPRDDHKEEEEEGSDGNANKDEESSAEARTARVVDQPDSSTSCVEEGPINIRPCRRRRSGANSA